MQAKVNTKELKAVIALHKKVSSKVSNFILTGILLTVKDNILELYNTDLETSFKSKIACQETSPGYCVVPFKNFDNIIACTDTTELEIELMENKTMIKSSHHPQKEDGTIDFETSIETEEEVITYKCRFDKVQLNCLPVDEYPQCPTFAGGSVISHLDFNLFKTALSKVESFYSTDISRPALTGIMLDIPKNTIVATNSYDLALHTFDFNISTDSEIEKVLIQGILYSVLKPLKAEKFSICIKENNIFFFINNQMIISRTLSGKFPDYEKLIPINFNYTYQFQADTLIKVVDKAVKVLKPDNQPVKLTFNATDITVSLNVKEVGEYADIIKSETIHTSDSEIHTIGFDPAYLKACIQYFKTVTISITDPLKPAIFYDYDGQYKTLLMPIRITS